MVNTADRALLKPVEVPARLPNEPGAQENLLPIEAIAKPLMVKIPMWLVSDPSEDEPETLTLFWNGEQVDGKTFTERVKEDELFLNVAPTKLTEGTHVLTYAVVLGNLERSDSEPFSVVIDKTPPCLGGDECDEGRLQFPEEIEQEGVTARYLELNGDVLVADVPDYSIPGVGDTIEWFWDAGEDYDYVDSRRLSLADLGNPISIEFTGDLIRERGDGPRHVHYRVKDRAGNWSARSRRVTLEVAAKPIQRDFPAPEVPEAPGGALALNDFYPPLLINVPTEAVIYPDDEIEMQWGEPDTFGHFIVPVEHDGRRWRCEVPAHKVAAQGGKTVGVRYVVTGAEGVLPPSLERLLRVARLTRNLQVVQLAGANAGQFSLAGAAARTEVTLKAWKFIAEGQQVTIEISGVGARGPESEVLLEAHVVSQGELATGVGTTVAKGFFEKLTLQSSFTLSATVSFDGGESWQDFPKLPLTLVR
ncbi:MAG: hypothetical protein RSD81_21500 [Pseudomonas sp.]